MQGKRGGEGVWWYKESWKCWFWWWDRCSSGFPPLARPVNVAGSCCPVPRGGLEARGGLGSESSQSRVRGLAARLSKSPPAAFLTSTSKKIRGQNLRRAASTVDFLVIRRPPSPRPTMGRGVSMSERGGEVRPK